MERGLGIIEPSLSDNDKEPLPKRRPGNDRRTWPGKRPSEDMPKEPGEIPDNPDDIDWE